mmetsp:Transcript_44807/g.135820  ORF Transcript_44807/g.135820 Transcript_44807/m.135820 type:complete len:255 (+) Transcript_44807:375-1139(+)
MLAVSEDFAIDEVATLLFEADDHRARQEVRVVTLGDVVEAAREAFPGLDVAAAGVFLLKLDVEGMEPALLRSLSQARVPVKFVTFEYASNVWPERLGGVVGELFAAGYFCFLITAERLFPISGPFWDAVYELPVWSNAICGREADQDLEALVQLHSGIVGLWPMLPRTYLAGFASADRTPQSLSGAQQLCLFLGSTCAGVTCECPGGNCGVPGPCTAREGAGGARRSPVGEVSFLRDPAAAEPFLLYRRLAAAA